MCARTPVMNSYASPSDPQLSAVSAQTRCSRSCRGERRTTGSQRHGNPIRSGKKVARIIAMHWYAWSAACYCKRRGKRCEVLHDGGDETEELVHVHLDTLAAKDAGIDLPGQTPATRRHE